MRKVALLVVCLVVAVSQGAIGETVIVPSTNINGALSSQLVSGQSYVFTASGVYQWDRTGLDWADAEWFHTVNYAHNPNEDAIPVGSNDPKDVFDLCINNTPVNWMGTSDGVTFSLHTYSPSHVYKYIFVGTGGQVKLHVADSYPFPNRGGTDWTGDNSGALTVNITPVPEPSCVLALLTGCGLLALRRRR